MADEKYTLQHNKPECIGCGACAAVAPEFWVMNDADNKSDIIDCKNLENGWEEKGIEEKDFVKNKDAAESCPVNVIHIVKKENNEKII